MSSRLFHTVVASSGLLLWGCSSVVTASGPRADAGAAAPDDVARAAPDVVIPAAPDVVTEAPDVVIPAPDVVAEAPDVVTAAPDVVTAALEDARSQEIGWPTTKGVYCWQSPSDAAVCCRSAVETNPHPCCLPVAGGCAPCIADDAGNCARTDAALELRP